MEFSFSDFDGFMRFVETEGKGIENWSEKDITKFNETVLKLAENADFKQRYDAWTKKIIEDNKKIKESRKRKNSRMVTRYTENTISK